MLFGLKNPSATYQWIVKKNFKNQIGRNMEAYVDDMLVKSVNFEKHLQDLQEVFFVLQYHQMKLNP